MKLLMLKVISGTIGPDAVRGAPARILLYD